RRSWSARAPGETKQRTSIRTTRPGDAPVRGKQALPRPVEAAPTGAAERPRPEARAATPMAAEASRAPAVHRTARGVRRAPAEAAAPEGAEVPAELGAPAVPAALEAPEEPVAQAVTRTPVARVATRALGEPEAIRALAAPAAPTARRRILARKPSSSSSGPRWRRTRPIPRRRSSTCPTPWRPAISPA